MRATLEIFQRLSRLTRLLSFSGTDRLGRLDHARPPPADHPPAARRAAGAAVGPAFGPRLSRLAGGATPPAAGGRCERSRIRWSTGWRGARSARGVGAVIARAPRAAIDCNRARGRDRPGGRRRRRRRRSARGARRARHRPRRGRAAHGHLWRRADRPRRTRPPDRPSPTGPIIRRSSAALDRLADRAWRGAAARLPFDAAARRGQADLVIGDRHGTSAAAWVTDAAARSPARAGCRSRSTSPMPAAMSSSATADPPRTSTRSSWKSTARLSAARRPHPRPGLRPRRAAARSADRSAWPAHRSHRRPMRSAE